MKVIIYDNNEIYYINKFKRALKNSSYKAMEASQKLSNAMKQTKCNIT